MIQSVRSSHSKYRVYLENQKKQKKEKIEDTQLSLLSSGISTLEDRKKVLQEVCNNYNTVYRIYQESWGAE